LTSNAAAVHADSSSRHIEFAQRLMVGGVLWASRASMRVDEGDLVGFGLGFDRE
jgi:hypothetical protein